MILKTPEVAYILYSVKIFFIYKKVNQHSIQLIFYSEKNSSNYLYYVFNRRGCVPDISQTRK